jgi:hypothetical protein
MSSLTIQNLIPFGEPKYSIFYNNDTTFIGNFGKQMINYDTLKLMCKTIMDGNYDTINYYKFNNIVFNAMNGNPDETNKIIFDVLMNVTENIRNNIKSAIEQNNFTITYFLNNYNKYYSHSEKLNSLLFYYTQATTRFQDKKKYSQVRLYRSYIFYANVINKKYTYDKENIYLYNIFNKYLEQESVNIDQILMLSNIHRFYDKFSYFAKDSRKELFNLEVNNKFLTTMGSNNEFIKNIVECLHKNITSLPKYDKLTQNFEHKKVSRMITSLMDMTTYFREKDMFNLMYGKYLEYRLLTLSTYINSKNEISNIELEKNIISMFKIPEDNKIIQKMYHQIQDIVESKSLCKAYSIMNVKIDSEKYTSVGITPKNINKSIINFIVLRHYTWEISTMRSEKFCVPVRLAVYIDIFNAMYNIKHPNRKLKWNFELGTAIIQIKINGKEYQFLVASPQLFLLDLFNDSEIISAKEMQEKLRISLDTLGNILNSLICARIIIRISGFSNDDPNVQFILNKNFSCPDSKINLAVLLDKKENPEIIKDEEIKEKFAHGREHITGCRIVKIMKVKKSMNYGDLYEETSKELPFKLTDDIFRQGLEWTKRSDWIREVNSSNSEHIDNINTNNKLLLYNDEDGPNGSDNNSNNDSDNE